jgi:outer membrane lipopolysaccharide assembly protein LptE/RlpB
MKKLVILFFIILSGCGYTTRGLIQSEKNIVITPVVNNISITPEGRRYSDFTTYPILIEKKLTNVITNKFNIDGHLKVSDSQKDALKLSCVVTDYKRETTRYTNTEDVKEQKLRLTVHMKLINAQDQTIKEKDVVGETSYFLSGLNSMTETNAQDELIEDTARRIVEAVIEEW